MTDSTSGLGPIHWQHYTHQAMWRMVVDDANPAGMFDEAEKLQRLAEHLGEITTQAHAVAKDVLGAWEGQAAEGAAEQITAFLRWADDTANTTNHIAGLLGQYAHVLNRARLSMPYPVQAGGLTQQGDTVTTAQAAASKTEAVHVMEHYATQSRDIYGQLGQHKFTAPPSNTGLPLPPPVP
ncbi:MAG TPA: PPE domain-containing protein [Pseudonocardiaceae bacterium]|nr:PPE domain-containing protein [Pseudonocardiaceae bacterium]